MNGLTPDQIQELLEAAKGVLLETGETVEEQMADTAFNRAAGTVLDRARPGEFRNPDDVPIMEALQAQTSALLGIGMLLEVVVKELRNITNKEARQ